MQEIVCMKKTLTGKEGYQVTCGSTYNFPIHTHMYYEMTCYENFDGFITVNHQKIHMDQSAIILVTPADFHKIQVNSSNTGRFIKAAFDEELLSSAIQKRLPGPLLLQPLADNSLPWLMFQELFIQRHDKEYAISLIHALALYLNRHGQHLLGWEGDAHHDRIIQAIRIINTRFCEAITLNEIAKALSLSPQYFSALFSKAMGIPFSEYIISLRLRLAADLLQHTEQSATEICFFCGFRNFSYFIRSFKKHYGHSPSAFRALHANGK